VEVAKRYPTAQVIGIDTSPVTRTDTPANCEFIVGDIIKSLANFDDESFDFVHSR
jgi:ubiquinone/menaquinone biosynthesis C-methylase UbiE